MYIVPFLSKAGSISWLLCRLSQAELEFILKDAIIRVLLDNASRKVVATSFQGDHVSCSVA